MKISYLLTGNELMSGDTVDSNSAMLSQAFKDIGIAPYKKLVVGDDMPLLVESIRSLAAEVDVLIINGGLGPTQDDLTAQAVAEAIGVPTAQHQQALEHLGQWSQARGFVVTESNLTQAELPKGCTIIDNPSGSAVGFQCEFQDCLILCTPGVPGELKPMLENHLLPIISARGAIEAKSLVTRLRLFGITESGLQDIINAKLVDWPAEVELGFRVQMPVIELKLGTLGEQHRSLNIEWSQKVQDLFSDYIIGRDNTRLSQSLNLALAESNLRLVTAESCTGGAIAAGVTSEAGSSQVFDGGFVVYSDQMKQDLLGVNQGTLDEFGAVSEQTVREMLIGALNNTRADIGIAISGIAGPGGGTAEKPVGTVWMAWGNKDELHARHFFLPMNRFAFQRTATAIAMDLVRRQVRGLPTTVDYFAELRRKFAAGK